MGSVKRKSAGRVGACPPGAVEDGKVGSSISSIPDGSGEASTSASLLEGSDCDFLRQSQSLNGRITGPKRRSTKGQWTPEEDEMLFRAVQHYHGKNWKKIAECFPGRTDVQCLHRWQKVLNPALVKGPWSKEEDEIIIEMVNKFGPKKWSTIAQALPGRIGKQCRERWHNHLNPAINKEAWTQEEEVALIHAHKIYGNKWAELTKFLPGRSDNSIKNHWHSSVKKKLDSYMVSGLIERYSDLPNIVSDASKMQQKSHKNSFKERPEIENSSECSSSAFVVASSQSECETEKPVIVVGDRKQGKDAIKKEVIDSHLPVCSTKFYGSVETTNPNPKVRSSKMLFKSTSTEKSLQKGRSGSEDNIPSKTDHNVNNNLEKKDILYHRPTPLQSSISVSGFGFEENDNQHTSLHNGCSSFISLSDPVMSAIQSSGTTINVAPHSHPLFVACTPEMFAIQCCQSFMIVPLSFICTSNNTENHDTSFGAPNPACFAPHVDDAGSLNHEHADQREECQIRDEVQCVEEVGTDTISCESPTNEHKVVFDKSLDSGARSLANETKDDQSEKFLDSFSDPETIRLADESKDVQSNKSLDSGSLFYEPPRIQSMEFPFVCCDIVSSDLQQAYSPLGIRQLMMSSASCNLLDSPSRDDSPDGILKHAAKSFMCTPSIIKKRQRELMSPLHETRFDKKSGTELNRGLFSSSLSREGEACMEDMIGDVGLSSKDDIFYPSDIKEKADATMQNKNLGNKHTQKKTYKNVSKAISLKENLEYRSETNVSIDVEYAKVPHCGVLKERNSTNSEHLSCHGFISPSPCGSKYIDASFKVTSLQYPPSLKKPQVAIDKFTPTTNSEHPTLNIFADTPGIKGGLDSPSAWKSPLFLNSFLAGTDMACEDFRYLMTPDEKSYDVLGLMKQLSEQNAVVMAEAQEVLSNGGQKLNFDIQSSDHISSQGDQDSAKGQENLIPMPSNIVAEGRVLDFSGCATTPCVKVQHVLGTSPIASPTSQLRGCR